MINVDNDEPIIIGFDKGEKDKTVICLRLGEAVHFIPEPFARSVLPLLIYTPPTEALRVVSEQAKDDGLWFKAKTAPEAYLQQELRRLHEAIEGKKADQCAIEALIGEG